MNEEDRRMQDDERDASPERYPPRPARPESIEEIEPPLSAVQDDLIDEKRIQPGTGSAASSSSRDSDIRRPSAMSRLSTQQNLERHPTTLSRIQTGKSQHSHTIGTAIRSRTSTRQAKIPIPNFGAGKPFPPDLPDREEYVVEFDGPEGKLPAPAIV